MLDLQSKAGRVDNEPLEPLMFDSRNMVRLSVPHGLLYVCDPEASALPEVDGRGLFWRNNNGLVLACRHEVVGETKIGIDEGTEAPAGLSLLGEFDLLTPSRRVAVQIVPRQTILEVPVESRKVRVEVWTEGDANTSLVWLRTV
jgi:hypothetical protein